MNPPIAALLLLCCLLVAPLAAKAACSCDGSAQPQPVCAGGNTFFSACIAKCQGLEYTDGACSGADADPTAACTSLNALYQHGLKALR